MLFECNWVCDSTAAFVRVRTLILFHQSIMVSDDHDINCYWHGMVVIAFAYMYMWCSTINKLEKHSHQRSTYKKWGTLERKPRWQLLTDMDGIRLWPNASTWRWCESRSCVLVWQLAEASGLYAGGETEPRGGDQATDGVTGKDSGGVDGWRHSCFSAQWRWCTEFWSTWSCYGQGLLSVVLSHFTHLPLFLLIYKGRLINKLQNSISLLVFHISKIQSIRFVWSLILSTRCKSYYDDVTETSFINIKYVNTATEIFPWPTACVTVFFWRQKILMQIRFTLRCIQYMAKSVLRSEQYTFGARWVEICIIYRGAISCSSVAWTAASIFLCIEHSEACCRYDKCLSELGRYTEKWNSND